jgi:DNA modification methylase
MIQVNKIVCSDTFEYMKQIPDGFVDCAITSPPYWRLRDYKIEGQFGLEKTPDDYVRTMVRVFREVKRVLKDTGTFWLNIGDSYSDKDLIGIPWKVAFALKEDGWYLRQDIIWHKPNCIPESVKDRCTKAHEYVFLFSKSKDYYFDPDAIKEDSVRDWSTAGGSILNRTGRLGLSGRNEDSTESKTYSHDEGLYKNKRSVWSVPTKPFTEAHFATFPEDLIEPMVKSATSEKGVCKRCGKPWVRNIKAEPVDKEDRKGVHLVGDGEGACGSTYNIPHQKAKREFLGWIPTCECVVDVKPAVVFDPFCGCGTACLVAKKLGRDYIGCDINQKYIDIANGRDTLGMRSLYA